MGWRTCFCIRLCISGFDVESIDERVWALLVRWTTLLAPNCTASAKYYVATLEGEISTANHCIIHTG